MLWLHCVAVSNHGISDESMDKVWQQTKALFALDPEAKKAIAKNKNNRGYTAIGDQYLDPTTQKQGDTKEGFYLGRCVTNGGSASVCKQTRSLLSTTTTLQDTL